MGFGLLSGLKKLYLQMNGKRMNYAKSTIVDFYVFGGRIVFTVFLYVASIVIPLLLLVAVFGFWWIRYKQQKALKLSDDVGLRQRRRRPSRRNY